MVPPMPERHQPTIDFLYSLMGHDPAAWPGLRAAGIPAAVQEWAAQDAARQQDLATVWADVCREQPYAEDEDMVSYTLDFSGLMWIMTGARWWPLPSG